MEAGMSAGYAITLLGMAIVFSFIAILALAIHLLSKFKGPVARPAAAAPRGGDSGRLVAILSAALHAHRSSGGRTERRSKP
jgi:sodium pump decarboxylase gamma subunit